MDTEAVLASLGRKYDHICQLFDDDKLEECIDKAQDVVEDGDLPRNLRIKTLIVIASLAAEWRDIEEFRGEAKKLWSLTRPFHREGYNAVTDDALAELRICLDHLQKGLIERRASDFGDERENVLIEAELFGGGEMLFEHAEALAKAESDVSQELLNSKKEALSKVANDKLKTAEGATV